MVALRLDVLRLKGEDKLGRVAAANADLLRRRVLEAGLGDLDNVVLELEVRQAQLARVRELRLKLSVEKNFCVVLTGNDEDRSQVVSGLARWLILFACFGWFFGKRRGSGDGR